MWGLPTHSHVQMWRVHVVRLCAHILRLGQLLDLIFHSSPLFLSNIFVFNKANWALILSRSVERAAFVGPSPQKWCNTNILCPKICPPSAEPAFGRRLGRASLRDSVASRGSAFAATPNKFGSAISFVVRLPTRLRLFGRLPPHSCSFGAALSRWTIDYSSIVQRFACSSVAGVLPLRLAQPSILRSRIEGFARLESV